MDCSKMRKNESFVDLEIFSLNLRFRFSKVLNAPLKAPRICMLNCCVAPHVFFINLYSFQFSQLFPL